jgi:TatD family-associated radical SAM protein
MNELGTVGYTLHGNRYLNLGHRCTLRCAFCPKHNGVFTVKEYDLLLAREPTFEEVCAAVGNPADYHDIVFCGLGEPTQRLDVLLAVAERFHGKGARIRVNTDGLASLVHGRDVAPELAGKIDALSISLNAQDEATYVRHCRPALPGAYEAMKAFARRAKEFVPDVTVTAIDGLEGVDIEACRRIAAELGVNFRRRTLNDVG